MAKKKIKVKLVRSFYGNKKDQINTVRSLGLRRISQIREHEDNDIIRGMIFKVKHLVEVL
jgi:large subunit ribosomal protein L30